MLLIQGARQKAVPRRIMGTSCRNAELRACPIGSPAAIPIPPHLDYVRFTLESRHSIAAPVCPLCATSGQMHCSKRILFGRFAIRASRHPASCGCSEREAQARIPDPHVAVSGGI